MDPMKLAPDKEIPKVIADGFVKWIDEVL